jgi:hypothetical protein
MMKAMFLSKWPWSPSTSTLPADDISELCMFVLNNLLLSLNLLFNTGSTVSNAFGNEVQLLVLGMYSAARVRISINLYI